MTGTTTTLNVITAVAQPVAKTRKAPTPRNFAENCNDATNAMSRMWGQTADMPGVREMFSQAYRDMLKLNKLMLTVAKDTRHAS
jgi:hypothetical protein